MLMRSLSSAAAFFGPSVYIALSAWSGIPSTKLKAYFESHSHDIEKRNFEASGKGRIEIYITPCYVTKMAQDMGSTVYSHPTCSRAETKTSSIRRFVLDASDFQWKHLIKILCVQLWAPVQSTNDRRCTRANSGEHFHPCPFPQSLIFDSPIQNSRQLGTHYISSSSTTHQTIMVLKIRLSRFGPRHKPFYNIVVAQAR